MSRDSSPARLRWFRPRFSLRWLLGTLIVCSLLFGWFANYRAACLREFEVARQLQERGGKVMFARRPWVVRTMGIGEFRHQGISPITWLPAEYFVCVNGYHGGQWNVSRQIPDAIDDELIDLIRQLPNLKWLRLEGFRIPNLDVSPLQQLPQLSWLHLNCQTTDEVVAAFSQQRNLNALHLVGNGVTSKSLFLLAQNPRLEELELSAAQISDADLAFIGKHGQLKRLSLACPITPAGLEHLTSLHQLEKLTLAGAQIDDTALPALQKMKSLRFIDLQNTNVSAKAKTELIGNSGLRTVK